jgi:hypothetical protein
VIVAQRRAFNRVGICPILALKRMAYLSGNDRYKSSKRGRTPL